MTWPDLLGILFGFGLGVLATFVLEALRSPRLKFSVEPSSTGTSGKETWKFASLRVTNRKLPWLFHLLDESASSCRAELCFFELRRTLGKPLIGPLLIDPIDGRWPTFEAEPIDYTTGALDVAAVVIPHRETISPGESVALNVAVKFQGEPQCYGFNNRSYGYQDDGQWRYSRQRLDSSRIIVRAVIHFEGEPRMSQEFVLFNDNSSIEGFRLEPLIP